MQAPFSTNRRKRFHFIGIGGIGMSALARILLDKKYWVQGSDRNKTAIIKELEEQGAVIYDKQTARNISKADIVVYSSAISQNNSEFEAAEALGCKMMHRSQLLAELASEKKGIAIAGTHGKTTTSSMLTAILLEAKLSPSYAIGGLLGKKNGERGQGGHFLFEADESDGSLVNYEPDCAVITSVDAEHMDHYKTKETLLECYESFASKVKDQLFYCGDDHQFALGSSYGFSEACDYTISNFRQKGWKLFFDLGEYEEIEVMATGRHNACNAAAAFLMARHLEIPISVIRSALKGFGGVSRRCERRSEKASVLRIDDYAHHPTEVHTALRGIKEAVGSRRIVALFQPHRYCRTQDHLEQFKRAFEWADCVYITDIFQAREKAIPFLSAHSVIEIVDHPDCRYIPREECDQIELRPHDVFVTLGAGDITSVEMKCEPKRWKVAVLAGGCSPEHEISLRSAQFVFDSLDEKLYERELIVLPEDGSWSEEALFSLRQAEVALPIMHGAYGEDGTIQGFLRTLKIPFAGSDHMACSLA
ncbi:MAG: UDP-N-acetylmuramate--L-alanine ligase, partial [Chlamydiae bacterium]|nr:UDP-N-acetylmuramate--L-alanine ligase [Chlamydiota bacterium]